jgi:glucokinase
VTHRIGIDLGGTKVLGSLVEGGEVRAQEKRSTPVEGGPDDVVALIAEVVEALGGPGDGVGIGAPGVVDVEGGIVSRAPNLPGWTRSVPLRELLSEALGGAPVAIDNDVNVAALAEHRLGAGRGVDDLLCVFVGTGVGGGLILDGRLRRGPSGLAGEIGHMIVQPGGRPCGCGGFGHLESYAGRAGLEREARRRHEGGEATVLLDLAKHGRMKSSVFAKALDAGDAITRELLDEAIEALGVALSATTALVDVELVVVGGGLADRLGQAFVDRMQAAVTERLFGPPLRCVPAALGDDAGTIGASLLLDAG